MYDYMIMLNLLWLDEIHNLKPNIEPLIAVKPEIIASSDIHLKKNYFIHIELFILFLIIPKHVICTFIYSLLALLQFNIVTGVNCRYCLPHHFWPAVSLHQNIMAALCAWEWDHCCRGLKMSNLNFKLCFLLLEN